VPVPYSLLLQLSSGAFTRSHALTLPYSVKSLRFPLQFCFRAHSVYPGSTHGILPRHFQTVHRTFWIPFGNRSFSNPFVLSKGP